MEILKVVKSYTRHTLAQKNGSCSQNWKNKSITARRVIENLDCTNIVFRRLGNFTLKIFHNETNPVSSSFTSFAAERTSIAFFSWISMKVEALIHSFQSMNSTATRYCWYGQTFSMLSDTSVPADINQWEISIIWILFSAVSIVDYFFISWLGRWKNSYCCFDCKTRTLLS